MNKLVFLFIFSLILFSCKKDKEKDEVVFLIPENEVPVWIKTEMKQIEQLRYCRFEWVRYNWLNEPYFEKIDLSTHPSFVVAVSFDGDTLTQLPDGSFNSDVYKRYTEEKCCKTFVWRLPSYIEI
jgi:hypothetical protein